MSNIIQFKKPKPPQTRIGVVIQARMTSQRFPGKSLAILKGKPVIQWTMERAKKIRGGRGNVKPFVVLAVPDTDDSEMMIQLAESLGVGNFCGDENNVLKRYYDCAIFFNFDVIMRLTGDCPFIDPRVCSEILQLLLWRKLDYCSNVFPKRTYPKGLDCEVFTMDALDAAYQLAQTDYEKEHVTPWMQNTKEVIKGNVEQQIDQSLDNWCVDYPWDIERIEQLIKNGKALKLLTVDGEGK
jgi:spore coat polysaccharide biosynthesis protein SpsF (cytidylyltransferase family)